MTSDGRSPKALEQSPDEVVVACILAGEREAYHHLIRRHQDLLYRHALRMTRQPDVAADLVQHAFVKAYHSLDRCQNPERVGAWLYRILANATKDYLKSRRRRDVRLEDAPHRALPADRRDPAQELERAELRQVLEDAVQQLPDALREAFLLKHVEGMAYEEMAERLDVSIPALKMRVHRARQTLQELLEEVR